VCGSKATRVISVSTIRRWSRTGIQPSIIKDIERAIRKLVAAGDIAILLVEQYYDFARSLADHYVVLSRGEVVAKGAGATMEQDNVRAHLAV